MTIRVNAALACVTFMLCRFVDSADIDYMRNTIIDNFPQSRNSLVNAAYKDAAMLFIFHEFESFGLETEFNKFTHVVAPGHNKFNKFNNVVACKRGINFGTAADKIIAVGAHYDTVANTSGVDSNGSGVTAMLEAARQVTEANIDGTNTVMFVAFDLEEHDRVGSEQFIKKWFKKYLKKNYKKAQKDLVWNGIIILDTLMEYNTTADSQLLPPNLAVEAIFPDTYESVSSNDFKGDFIALIYRLPTSDAALAAVFESFWNSGPNPEFKIETLPIPIADIDPSSPTGEAMADLLRSDHTSFWVEDYPAIYLTDTGNFRGDMQYCYQSPCDDLATMMTDENMNFIGKTADTVAATLLYLMQA